MIEVKNLQKAFGGNMVLKGVTETIEKGEKIAIIGPSGSGKSTFLRCLNRLEEPTGGEIWFEGKDITAKDCDINRIRRKVNFWRVAYPQHFVTKEDIIVSFTAWDAHAAHGDTHSLRAKYAKIVSDIIGEEIRPRRKINSTKKVAALRRLKQAKAEYRKKHKAEGRPTACFSAPMPDDQPPW